MVAAEGGVLIRDPAEEWEDDGMHDPPCPILSGCDVCWPEAEEAFCPECASPAWFVVATGEGVCEEGHRFHTYQGGDVPEPRPSRVAPMRETVTVRPSCLNDTKESK